MAADCKSAAPWSYGGSNPPLCTSFFEVLILSFCERSLGAAASEPAGNCADDFRRASAVGVADISGRKNPAGDAGHFGNVRGANRGGKQNPGLTERFAGLTENFAGVTQW